MVIKRPHLFSVLLAGMFLGATALAGHHPEWDGKLQHEEQAGRAAKQKPDNMISLEKAKAGALKQVPGTIKSSELEKEAGKWIYSFDILAADKNLHEVWVDAISGKVLRTKVESAGEEAKEVEHGSR